nr:hypothetical protein [Tanacetum cinerariifolium]
SLSSLQHKPELRPTKHFEAKYNKVKAKLALLSSNASASKASTALAIRPLFFTVEALEAEAFKLKSASLALTLLYLASKCLVGLSSENSRVDQLTVDPSSSGQKDLVFVKSLANDTKVSILGVERPWLSKAEGFILPNHDTGRILPAESQRNITDPSVAIIDSSVTNYDSTEESSVCSTPLHPLKNLDSAEPVSRPKTIKSILRLKFTFKAETSKGVIINEPSSALDKDNKSSSASKVNSVPAVKLKSVKIKDDPPLAIVIKELNNLKLQFSKS